MERLGFLQAANHSEDDLTSKYSLQEMLGWLDSEHMNTKKSINFMVCCFICKFAARS